jgi:adenine-specific DNA-methyltransferase
MAKKDYSKLTKDQLLELVDKLQGKKKYGLVWDEDRLPEEVVTDCQDKFPVLKEVKGKEITTDENKPTHILIEGDNYHVLSVLNYTHKGKVDFVYIDPPYNTGSRDWRYNNDYVDDTDTFRHSKWLQFMKNRLDLAKNILADDGIICVTIDDYEMPRLWILLEEIFGYENHLGTVVIRNNPKGRMTKRKFSLVHEYGIFFGKTSLSYIKKLPENPEDKTHNYKQDKNGEWFLPVNLRKQGVDSNAVNKKGKLSDRYFPIYYDPKTGKVSSKEKLKVEILPIDSKNIKRIWRRSKDVIDEMYENGEIWVNKIKDGYQVYYKFTGGLDGKLAQSIWVDSQCSASDYGTKILDNILGEREKFQYPKAPYAVKQSILSATDKKDAIIVDFFAGSGTTGQAVLELNEEDGGNRKFIICTNNENNIAEEVTYKRVRNVIKGYSDHKGIDANLRYFKTSFVNNNRNKDQLKIDITKRCTEMLCLKENIFNLLKEETDYKIFKQGNRYLAVYYDFANDSLEDLKEEMNNIKGEKILYCFTVDNNGLDKANFRGWKNIQLEPIPQKILDVYKRIFKY